MKIIHGDDNSGNSGTFIIGDVHLEQTQQAPAANPMPPISTLPRVNKWTLIIPLVAASMTGAATLFNGFLTTTKAYTRTENVTQTGDVSTASVAPKPKQ